MRARHARRPAPAYSDVGGGHGGYNQEHELFGYRRAI
jgi:hypothetical protein